MLYYQGYEIPEKDYLSSEEKHVLYACHWMVDNCSTIRKTAINCGYSATTFWRRIWKGEEKSNGFYGSKDYEVWLFSC